MVMEVYGYLCMVLLLRVVVYLSLFNLSFFHRLFLMPIKPSNPVVPNLWVITHKWVIWII